MSKSARRRFAQSAVIPYRGIASALEVLIITSRRRRRWVVPKGLVEPHLTPAASALEEAWEEAGLRGRIQGDPLGTYEYRKWGGVCDVEVFAMAVAEVASDWPEREQRSRVWLPPAHAADLLEEPDLQALVRGVEGRLGRTRT